MSKRDLVVSSATLQHSRILAFPNLSKCTVGVNEAAVAMLAEAPLPGRGIPFLAYHGTTVCCERPPFYGSKAASDMPA